MKKFPVIIIFLLFFTSLSYSLEIEMGKIKLVLHEENGKISLYSREYLGVEEYTSLFLEEDPGTSGISILVDNEKKDPGFSFELKQKLYKTSYGAKYQWTSKTLNVTEKFSPIKSINSQITDGLRIDISIKNISNREMKVGMKYLFDTWLGEKNNYHFYTSEGDYIKSEKKYTKYMPDYWVSSEGEKAKTELLVMLRGDGVTPPDEVIFANWKRLDTSIWTINFKANRNFDLQPYSINDSAVCHYYHPVTIFPGESRDITLLMGNPYNGDFSNTSFETIDKPEENYIKPEEKYSAPKLNYIEPEVNYSNPKENEIENKRITIREIIENELILTEDIINYIDDLFKKNESIDEESINSLVNMINKLEKIKNGIDNK